MVIESSLRTWCQTNIKHGHAKFGFKSNESCSRQEFFLLRQEIAERRDDHSEALEQSTDEYRKIINSLSVEIEGLKEQMRQTTKIFERVGR